MTDDHRLDDALRALMDERARRRPPAAADTERLTTKDVTSLTVWQQVLVAASVLLVVGVAVGVAQRLRSGGADEAVSSGVVEAPAYEPDPTLLPFPKFYRGGSQDWSGNGRIRVPGGDPSRSNVLVARYQLSGNWMDWDFGDHDEVIDHVDTRMTWTDLSAASPPDMSGRRVRQVEADAILFQASSNDPEVSDEQLQAMLGNMVQHYCATVGASLPSEIAASTARLVPAVTDLPTLPPTPQLEAQYEAATELDLDWYAPVRRNTAGELTQEPEGHVLEDRDRHAFPVFTMDGHLLGIYVAGLGVVPREQYETPGFDPSVLAPAGF